VTPKCPHGYYTHSPFNRCPWCHSFDETNRDVIPVIGHGNGGLLRRGALVCPSCGGPGDAGWGMIVDAAADTRTERQCYGCRIGENTKEAIARRATHESSRAVKKAKGSKESA
jgi:hypothetical protein